MKRLVFLLIPLLLANKHAPPDSTKIEELNKQLILAVSLGNADQVSRSLKMGADPNARNSHDENTPLMNSVLRESLEMVKILIQGGADVNAKSIDGETTVHMACLKGNLKILEQLIEADSDLQTQDEFGRTALFYALEGESPAVVDFLLEKGVDPGIQDIAGETAGTSILYKPAPWALLEPFEKFDVSGRAIKTQMLMRSLTVEYLHRIEQGKMPVNIADKEGMTPLMSAAQRGKTEVVQALVKAGADVKARTKYGYGALALAIAHKRDAVVRILVDLGLKMEPTELDGYAAHLQHAAGSDPEKRTRADMRVMTTACQAYAMNHKKYPESSGRIHEILGALQPAYLHHLPFKDAWGNDFSYYSFPKGRGFCLVSSGPNGKKDRELYDDHGLPPILRKDYKEEEFTFDFSSIYAGDLFKFMGNLAGLRMNVDPDLMEKELHMNISLTPYDMVLDMSAYILRASSNVGGNEIHVSKFRSNPDDIIWITLFERGECF